MLRRLLGAAAPPPITERWIAEDFDPPATAPGFADPWDLPASPAAEPPTMLREPAPNMVAENTGPPALPPPPPDGPHIPGPIGTAETERNALAEWDTADALPFAPPPLSADAPWADALVPAQAPPKALPPPARAAGYDPDLHKARVRAAAIGINLSVTSRHELDGVLDWLVPYLLEHPHAATFRALLRESRHDLGPATLHAMLLLRRHWAERPDLWLIRCRYSGARGRLLTRWERGGGSLSWRLARRIAELRCDHPIEDMIDDAWVEAWLALSESSPGWTRFIEFLALQIEAADDTLMRKGLALMADERGYSDQAPARRTHAIIDARDGEELRLPTATPRRQDF